MEEKIQYTWSLKTTWTWEIYTWSVKSFKEWKNRLYSEYFSMHWRRFKEDFPSKEQREFVYKRLLWFSSVDVFWTWRDGFWVVICQEVYENAKRVSDIISNR